MGSVISMRHVQRLDLITIKLRVMIAHKSVHFPPFYDNISVDATGTTFLYVFA